MSSTALLNFYTFAHSLGSDEDDLDRVLPMFWNAFDESMPYAVVAAFHMRDARGGWGQREAFRMIMRAVLPELSLGRVNGLIRLIPEYGRWDDLLLLGTLPVVGRLVCSHVCSVYAADLESDTPSLLGKYLPSENASSETSKTLADFWTRMLMKSTTPYETVTPADKRAYRRSLSKLRAKLNIVERQMSAGKWAEIDYSKVPAAAMRRYGDAFQRHDGERFLTFLRNHEYPRYGTPIYDMTLSGMMAVLNSKRMVPVWGVVL